MRKKDVDSRKGRSFPMIKALYYTKLDNNAKCLLCPRECTISPEQRGYCGAKENRNGELYSTLYAKISAVAMDPIEKKPLYHFYPGSEILSIGTIGCNLRCEFCQNWHIAQSEQMTCRVTSQELVELILEHGGIGVAYTYSEPLIWYEYILDTARLVQKAGLKNVLVTNGLIHREPLKELLQYIDAINLDVKAFRQKFYKEVCGGEYLHVVKETAKLAAKMCHLEVTTLLIPGLNDDPEEIRELAEWLGNINPDIPLHFSRYFPQYKISIPPTSITQMYKAKEITSEYLNYIYLGNLVDEDRNTYCPQCHYPVVKRNSQVKVQLINGDCPKCGTKISVVS